VGGRKADIGAFDSPSLSACQSARSPASAQTGSSWKQRTLHNGDGLSYLHKREMYGPRSTRRSGGQAWRVFPNSPLAELHGLKVGTPFTATATRLGTGVAEKSRAPHRHRMKLAETTDGLALTLSDADGCSATASIVLEYQPAQQANGGGQLRENLGKLGNTLFSASKITLDLPRPWFVPAPPQRLAARSGGKTGKRTPCRLAARTAQSTCCAACGLSRRNSELSGQCVQPQGAEFYEKHG